ncbi:MAG: putative membrane protein [Gammaproteobacteria bacterium]|jgi:putative membrane protein
MTAALFAFAHFLALFALTTALVTQLVLLSGTMTVETARRIQRADRVYGLSAGLLLLFGLGRVIWFEKGTDYYFHNLFFLTKIVLFVIAGLLSTYPTRTYLGWRRMLAENVLPDLSDNKMQSLKKSMHWQLIIIMAVIFCASMMAKGFGKF